MSEAQGPQTKKKRLGFRRACIPCRRKKHRCDGAKPSCMSCTSHGFPCRYSSSESTDDSAGGNATPTTHQDQQHTDSYSISPQDSYSGLGNRRPCVDFVSNTLHAENQGGTAIISSEKELERRRSSNSIWSSGGGAPSKHSPKQQTLSQPHGYFGDSSSFRFVSGIRPESRTGYDQEKSPIEVRPSSALNRITVDGAHRTDHINRQVLHLSEPCDSPNSSYTHRQVYADSRNGLPSHELADRPVDAYFDHVHVLYPFLHEGKFRSRYEALWAEGANSNCAEPTVWLAIVNLVFAYGYEFCAGQRESFSVLAAPFADRAKAMVLSHVFRSSSIELVQALLLLCHYLQSTLQLNECWNLVGLMIRGAVSIGLHLNPVMTGAETSMVEKEERKRAWWGCFVLDRTLSMKFGRPPSIIFDDAKNVDLPLQVDDQYIGDTSSIPRQPWGRPSRLSFFTHTIKLSEVVGNILSNMYNMGSRRSQVESMWWSLIPEESTKLGNVVLLDGQLQAWWDDMPGHLKDTEFKIGPMGNLLEGRDFQRQRLVMRIRFLQMRLLLQRPCFILLSKNKIHDDLRSGVALSSAKVCMSVARETIQLVHLHYDKQLLNSLWYNLHYVFTSLGVLVTAQTLEEPLRSLVSSSEDAQALHDGMKFLRSAGRNSGLASRYVAMLSKANTVPPLQSDRASNSLVTDNTQDKSEGNGSLAINEEVISVDTTSGMGRNETRQPQQSCFEQGGDVLETVVADFDFARLDFNNPLDLLFGTGLPQDFLLTDWTTDEAMIL